MGGSLWLEEYSILEKNEHVEENLFIGRIIFFKLKLGSIENLVTKLMSILALSPIGKENLNKSSSIVNTLTFPFRP